MRRIAAIAFLVASALLALLALLVTHRAFRNASSSMEPTLHGAGGGGSADLVLANLRAYRGRAPQRGDLVIFETRGIAAYPGVPAGDIYLKRVAGLPGERVSIAPPDLLVNGRPVEEPVFFSRMRRREDGRTGFLLAVPGGAPAKLAQTSDAIQLGADEYLLLGDNAESSLDGRYFGPVRREAILGRVDWIYYPPARAGRVE